MNNKKTPQATIPPTTGKLVRIATFFAAAATPISRKAINCKRKRHSMHTCFVQKLIIYNQPIGNHNMYLTKRPEPLLQLTLGKFLVDSSKD